MTRKRFVKLLRSKGYDRVAINSFISAVARNGTSYANSYKAISRMPRTFVSISLFRDSILRAKKEICRLAKAMKGEC